MPKSKYNRTDFYVKNRINGVLENDLVTNSFQDFTQSFAYQYYTLRQVDIKRFDILSLRFYRTDRYWWILAKVNNVDDLWNDAEGGDVIKIPDKRDIENFYIKITRSGNRG
jgi:hypothetical protein